jgi:hypothetical protein
VRVAWRELTGVSAVVALLLLVAAGGYGYHRDELYFIVIGGSPDWGYVDQPPLVPMLAHAMASLSDALWVFRTPAALAAGGVVLVTGLTAAELGASRLGQVLAASCMGVGAVTLAAGHLMGTTIFDMLAWSAVVWLAVAAIARDERLWLVAGLVAGVGLQVKTLMAFLLAALALALVVVGPRRVLRSPWLWGGVGLAVLVWAPNLVWQQANGWPQLELASAISEGGSGTSADRWVFLPYQLVLVSPVLAPVWLLGLVRLLRSPDLRPWRFVGVAYLVLLVVFLVTQAKPYYLAGLFPVLLAAGSEPVVSWVREVRGRGRGVVTALVVSLAVAAVLFLPVVPEDRLAATPITDVNYDAGETVGWPGFADQVATAYDGLADADAVVLTGNYGEMGALRRYRPDVPVHSGHNALADLGPPPEGTRTVLAVGIDEESLRSWCGSLEPVGEIDNGLDLDNDEQGASLVVCRDLVTPWAELWPEIRRLG